MSFAKVKKELNKMEKNDVINLISALYKKVPAAQDYLDVMATGDLTNIELKYKKQIEKYLYPSGKSMLLQEVEARKIIRSVRKLKITELNVTLELHYVSCCLSVIEDFGYWDERYYLAIETMFSQAIKGINELNVHDQYDHHLESLVSRAHEYGLELYY